MPLAHHPTLLCHYNIVIGNHFPVLQCDAETLQHSFVAQGLGIIAHQQQLQINEAHYECKTENPSCGKIGGQQKL